MFLLSENLWGPHLPLYHSLLTTCLSLNSAPKTARASSVFGGTWGPGAPWGGWPWDSHDLFADGPMDLQMFFLQKIVKCLFVMIFWLICFVLVCFCWIDLPMFLPMNLMLVKKLFMAFCSKDIFKKMTIQKLNVDTHILIYIQYIYIYAVFYIIQIETHNVELVVQDRNCHSSYNIPYYIYDM